MSKRVIADCGSTKIHWAVVENGALVSEFFTTGVNPMVMGADMVAGIFGLELPGNMPADADIVAFYGAGCKGDAAGVVTEALSHHVSGAEIIVETDMLGACRALLGDVAGVACILGTGSNSCLYDGERIIANVSPGGYILGDEGSGAWLGRRFAGDFIKGLLPGELSARFQREYGLDASEIIRRVYRPSNADTPPNRFLASFAPFISANICEPCLGEIVREGFEQFFHRNVAQYFRNGDECRNMTVNFAGSVATAFETQLRDVASSLDYKVGVIVKNPLERLVARAIDADGERG